MRLVTTIIVGLFTLTWTVEAAQAQRAKFQLPYQTRGTRTNMAPRFNHVPQYQPTQFRMSNNFNRQYHQYTNNMMWDNKAGFLFVPAVSQMNRDMSAARRQWQSQEAARRRAYQQRRQIGHNGRPSNGYPTYISRPTYGPTKWLTRSGVPTQPTRKSFFGFGRSRRR